MDARRITTKRLELRPLAEADRTVMAGILNDLAVSRWLARVPHPFRPEDCKITGADGRETWPERMAICHNGRFVGVVSIAPHLGYFLAPDAWGQGLMTEAVAARLADHFGRHPTCDRVVSGHFEGNAASARILARMGFRETGRGQRLCEALGRDLPHVDMTLTRADREARSWA